MCPEPAPSGTVSPHTESVNFVAQNSFPLDFGVAALSTVIFRVFSFSAGDLHTDRWELVTAGPNYTGFTTFQAVNSSHDASVVMSTKALRPALGLPRQLDF